MDKELQEVAVTERISEFKTTIEHVVAGTKEFAEKEFQEAAATYTSVTERTSKFEITMEHVVGGTKEFAEQ